MEFIFGLLFLDSLFIKSFRTLPENDLRKGRALFQLFYDPRVLSSY
jgi:hypothetical protein